MINRLLKNDADTDKVSVWNSCFRVLFSKLFGLEVAL
jgi:hypothetical protein